MKVSRFKQVTLAVVLLLIIFCMFSQTYSVIQLPQSIVGIVQSEKQYAGDIQETDIRTMIAEAVSLIGGLNGIIHNGDTVVIKPNLVCIETMEGLVPPEVNGITTDWRVIKAIAGLVREINPDGTVYVMEGSAYSTPPIMEHLLYDSNHIPGVDAFLAIEEDSGGWLDYSSPNLVKVDLPGGMLNTSYYLNKKYKEADVLISVPTLKNHGSACITGSLKNVGIGATPGNIYGRGEGDPYRGNMVSHFSTDLHEWIHDWNLCRPVDLVIMDGLQGFQNGPGTDMTPSLAADQMNMRMILAGTDPVAVDTIESLCMNWDPQSVPHLVYLNNSSAGNLDTACITVKGKKVADVKKNFEGRAPFTGGSKVTDNTPPQLTVTSSLFENGTAAIALTVAPEAVKAEVYIDGQLRNPVITSNYNAISIDINDLSQGDHMAEVYAYDRFLNYSVASIPFAYYTQNPTPTPGTQPTPSQDELGDVNSNGTVDIVDALLVAQYYVGLDPGGFNPDTADTNCNMSIDIVDALLIAQYYVGLIMEFC
ncbi:MAG: DUF362 domain-containing protein [Spirochaetales bacterium]|nr:DUF362 domain-containing protein [Spirochaetales bacterium]